MTRPLLDLSFINPQALSRDSWILRLPLLDGLASRAAWWNAFFVETFELVTNERPESCEALLDAAFPTWPNVPNPRWLVGYVWHGGFTIQRLTPWRNPGRAIGTGVFSFDRGVTHVAFRVGPNRFGVYALAVLALGFGVLGLFMLWAAAAARTDFFWVVVGVLGLLLPLAIFITLGRTIAPDGRSEEATRLLAAVADIIGTQEVPRG